MTFLQAFVYNVYGVSLKVGRLVKYGKTSNFIGG